MNINRAFWDSSALIPLFCSDSYSRQSRELLRRFPQVVVWWNTSTEIHGAFVRLFEQGHLTKEGLKKSLQYHDQLRLRWREVLPVPELRDLADQCMDQYRLRSADSLQLAAALIWCKHAPKLRPFICFEAELRDAALASGFDVHSK